ncbi:MFS general substrate transporter [Cryphonectria parasitica EP155]|uniref:MFS general substrate transporter n=1 Tax=Cryphonectria parasitica (strain ATCC 38755 / EP155) TaxID=660469 RepID=A0A9P4XUA0_CRYP1|nr:MFS general substrate transporter [Cryphonectria parasitica EP155]KAF3761041.1 MFS general substrate transporter [Cryphonectria parasitica EP155]
MLDQEKQEQQEQQQEPGSVAAQARKKSPSFHFSILLLGLIGFLVALDATSLATAIPVIGNELDGTTIESFWAGIAFTLAVAITQPVYSSVSDVLGRKIPLYAGLFFFTIGSIVFSSAKSMGIAILGRILMGLGGGGLDVLQVIILSDVTTLRERPLYMAVNAVFNATGAVLGLILGGTFSEYVTWRWLGWFNLPFLAICFLLTFVFLNIKAINSDLRQKLERLDWIGMLLFATGGTCLALPLSWANALFPWSAWQTLFPLIIGLLLLGILGWYEGRPASPVFPYRIFSTRTANAALISGTIHGLLMYTISQYLPLFYEAVYLHTPLETGIATLPYCGVTIVFSAISGVVVIKIRQYRLVLWVGWILSTIFIGLLYLVRETTSTTEAYIYQAFMGVGVGTVLTVTAFPTQASVSHVDDVGIAAGMLVIFRLFGALLGLTMASTVFSSVFQQRMNAVTAAMTLPDSLEVLKDASQAVGFIPHLRELSGVVSWETMSAVIAVYTRSFQVVWLVFTGFFVVGFAVSLSIQELSMENDDVGRQGLAQ